MSMRHRFEAYVALVRRYATVLAHCWKYRRELTPRRLSIDEAAFLPAALALQAQPVSPAGRWGARLISGAVLVTFIWSLLGRIDIVVHATGKIIPSAHTQAIASVEVARVRAIEVREGQAVKAGDVLIELDARMPEAERDKAIAERDLARLAIARSKAMIAALDTGRAPVLPPVDGVAPRDWQTEAAHLAGDYQDFRAQLQRLDADIARDAQMLPLVAKREADYAQLVAAREVSVHDYLEHQQARLDLAGQLAAARAQRAALVAQTRKTALDALAQALQTDETSDEDARRAQAHCAALSLTAPVDGTVHQLTLHTVGGVVPAAQPLLQIVPAAAAVEVEATLANRDVGFVRPGQDAQVKVEAFDYTKYGTVPARVTLVSRDAVLDGKRGLIYTVRVVLDRATLTVDGEPRRLSPGMAVTVDLKTGTRRVIDYVLSPLIDHVSGSLHER